jgi:initiation factor 1A
MVKNSTGGNKSKKQARKTAIQNHQPAKEIRKAKEEGEMYAAVSKMFGGKECEVMCIDHKVRRCVMRSKFMFRGKAENNLSVGTMILVGLRDWEVRHTGSERCDLLEVYSQSEKERLKQYESCDFTAISALLIGASTKEEEVFSNFHDTDEDEDKDKDEDEDETTENVVMENVVVEQAKVFEKETAAEKENVKNQVDWIIDENDI